MTPRQAAMLALEDVVARAKRMMGFNVNPHIKKCKDIAEVMEYCNNWENKRDELDYMIDGMVVKVDSSLLICGMLEISAENSRASVRERAGMVKARTTPAIVACTPEA